MTTNHNPSCQHCGNPKTHRYGATRTGTQRYYCSQCCKAFTLGTRHGGQNKIDDGLTAQQRYERANRAKISERQRQRRKAKKDQNKG
jgi:transposase-like protein